MSHIEVIILALIIIILTIIIILAILLSCSLSLADAKTSSSGDFFTFQRKLSQVHPNAKFDASNLTERNFIQGALGNCGMIATQASLANNRELLKEVVPGNQRFENNPEEVSEFRFNFFKYGKPRRVVVDEIFHFWNYNLTLNDIFK